NPNVKVPPQLESIVFRALEKSRDARFATAGDFAASLESIRNTIPPDQKYGLGERMLTLSAQKTVTDVPKLKTGQAATLGSVPTDVTRAGGPARTLGTQPTIVERKTVGSDEATVLERVGSQAEPTVLERQGAPRKSNVVMISAIAAGVVIVVGIALAVLLYRPTVQPPTGTAGGSSTAGGGGPARTTTLPA